MNNEKLMNAIGLLDDYVLRGTQIDAPTDVQIPPVKKSKGIYLKLAAMAASLVIIILLAVLAGNSMNEPEEISKKPLLAVVKDTLPPETEEVMPTEEVLITKAPVATKAPVPEKKENEEDRAFANIRTPAPDVNITEPPIISYPDNDVEIPDEEQPLQSEEPKEETSTEIPESTEAPTFTAEPEEDTWTETFVATNEEYSFGIDKSDTKKLVEQLYYSELGVNILGKEDNDWWYGVKLNECVYTQAEVEVADNYIENYIGEGLLKGIHINEHISKETKAYIYKITGVSESAAVAVRIDEQEGYYLFINPDFKTETFSEFVEAYNLKNYSDLNAVAIYGQGGHTISENIDGNVIWDILTAGGGYAVDYKSLYFDYEIAAGIKMEVSIYGCADVPITLFDEGYVVVYLGEINGAYYVGADKIALIKGRVNNSNYWN